MPLRNRTSRPSPPGTWDGNWSVDLSSLPETLVPREPAVQANSTGIRYLIPGVLITPLCDFLRPIAELGEVEGLDPRPPADAARLIAHLERASGDAAIGEFRSLWLNRRDAAALGMAAHLLSRDNKRHNPMIATLADALWQYCESMIASAQESR